jgi:hypothetical protein
MHEIVPSKTETTAKTAADNGRAAHAASILHVLFHTLFADSLDFV